MGKISTKTISVNIICLLLILTSSAGFPTKTMAADTIKIGFIDVLSGVFESSGRMFLEGVKFAVHEKNEKGGLLGKKIEVLTEDSELKPDVAIRKAKNLILGKNVDFLYHGIGTHVTLALSRVATEHKKILLTGAVSEQITGREFSPYVFRVVNNNYGHTSALARFMATKPYRRFYVICQDYAFGHDAAKAFKEHLMIHLPGAQIAGEDYPPVGNKDFAPYINKIIAAKADAVFTGSWGADLTNLLKQSRSMGLKTPFPFVIATPIDPPAEYELGDNAIGIHSCYTADLRVKTPENEAFITRYHEMHKYDKDFTTWWPVTVIGTTYNEISMLLAAVEKAGTLNPEKIIETFENFEFKTNMGLYKMRKCDHQVLAPVYCGEVTADPNPWFNGSIRPDVKFHHWGPEVKMFSAMEVAIPATPDYNPRCR